MVVKVSLREMNLELRVPFRISGDRWTSFPAIEIELQEGRCVGRGEALGVDYLGESPATMIEQIEAILPSIEAGVSRAQLLGLLPPGGARNAIDCALWDLEAKGAGMRVWQLAGLDLKPIHTVMTIGLEDSPSAMAEKARAAAAFPVLKVKLNDDRPVERIEAIRKARPDAVIVIDANQGWSFEVLREVAEPLKSFGVAMIEQPLLRGSDESLEGYDSPLAICADESFLHSGELVQAARRYQMINIKLDKSGGLTHALEIGRMAKHLGLRLMVGCMGGTSLSMAPAFVMGLMCDFHDLDGPLLHTYDRPFGLEYQNGRVTPPEPELWG